MRLDALVAAVILAGIVIVTATAAKADGTESRIAEKLGYDLYHQAVAASEMLNETAPGVPWFGCSRSGICYSLSEWCQMRKYNQGACRPQEYAEQ